MTWLSTGSPLELLRFFNYKVWSCHPHIIIKTEISEWRKPSAYLMIHLTQKKPLSGIIKHFYQMIENVPVSSANNDEKRIEFNCSRECFTGVQHTQKSTEIIIILPSAHFFVKPPRLSKIFLFFFFTD